MVLIKTQVKKRKSIWNFFESAVQVGGMLIPGSKPVIKFEAANYLEDLRAESASARKECALLVL
jgi:hypothetical protein